MLAGSLDVETSLLVIPSFRTLSGCVLVFVETVLQDLRSIKIFLAPLQTSVDRTLLSSQPDEHFLAETDVFRSMEMTLRLTNSTLKRNVCQALTISSGWNVATAIMTFS